MKIIDPKIGQRVLLEHLMYSEKFPGEIIGVDVMGCVVKLDRQSTPVYGVLYFSHNPGDVEIPASHWQICYPEVEE